MLEERDTRAPQRGEQWVTRDDPPRVTAGAICRELDETLCAIGTVEAVCEACCPAEGASGAGGCSGIDPVVSFWRLMIGFFETLVRRVPSARFLACWLVKVALPISGLPITANRCIAERARLALGDRREIFPETSEPNEERCFSILFRPH